MRRIVWLAWATAGVVIIVAAGLVWRGLPAERTVPQLHATAAAGIPKSEAKPAATAAVPPSFDIVTVERNGQAVIAGRAMPGDRVKVLDGDKTIGEVTADRRGEWALVPKAPIPPGNRQLSLQATAPDGGAPRRSTDVVALSVAPPAAVAGAASSALAVLLPGAANGKVRVLQQPTPAQGGQALSLDTVESGEGDRLVLSGHADPGARLNIFAGEQLLGTATADSAGKWSLTASHPAITAKVELRLAELGAIGGVAQRVAVPLAAPQPGARGTYVVARGNSLWLIARHAYGDGARYTAIYHANRVQIRDPDLIYPGQHFRLPHS